MRCHVQLGGVYPMSCDGFLSPVMCILVAFYPMSCDNVLSDGMWLHFIRCDVQLGGFVSDVMCSVMVFYPLWCGAFLRFIQRHLITFHPMACESILSTVLRGGVLSYVTICNAFYPMWCTAWWRFILCFGMAFYPLWCAAWWPFIRCDVHIVAAWWRFVLPMLCDAFYPMWCAAWWRFIQCDAQRGGEQPWAVPGPGGLRSRLLSLLQRGVRAGQGLLLQVLQVCCPPSARRHCGHLHGEVGERNAIFYQL